MLSLLVNVIDGQCSHSTLMIILLLLGVEVSVPNCTAVEVRGVVPKSGSEICPYLPLWVYLDQTVE